MYISKVKQIKDATLKKLAILVTAALAIGATPALAQQYSRAGALREACEAGMQYRNDVDSGWMKHSQSEYEARQYSSYLAANSPAQKGELYRAVTQGLWMFNCSGY